ncbi:hypothetical protein JCM3770_003897 [Rhodotorula araucariae]
MIWVTCSSPTRTTETMSIQSSRSKVVPTLWQSIIDREFATVERMLAPGAFWEVFPAATRPFFAPPLPLSGVFDRDETLDYFKAIREKLLSDPKGFEMRDTSQGENSLTARYITKGIDKDGDHFDVSHTLFVEFDPRSDKIQRGVEYLDSESMQLHLKREADKQEWEDVKVGQKHVEGAGKEQQKVEAGAAAAAPEGQQQPQQAEAGKAEQKETANA